MFIGGLRSTLPILLGIAVILYGVKSSRGSPLENDVTQQKLMMERVNGLESKMNQLSVRLEEEVELRKNLQTLNSELVMQIDQLVTENMEQNQRLERLESEFQAKIDILRAQQDEEIRLLKNTPTSIKKNSMPIESDSSPRLPPSSCRQLSTIGHYLDGIYLVANPDTKKIEAIYCEFGSSTLSETFYGSVDVRSKAVHFTVQRTSSFAVENSVIPFDIERLNVGGAMNLATGVFIAPVDGIYHFDFKGLKSTDPTALFIFLQVNGVNIGSAAYATYLPNYLGLSGISASLKLKTGDQVRLFKTTGTIYDDVDHYTFFTGWLVEEDLLLD